MSSYVVCFLHLVEWLGIHSVLSVLYLLSSVIYPLFTLDSELPMSANIPNINGSSLGTDKYTDVALLQPVTFVLVLQRLSHRLLTSPLLCAARVAFLQKIRQNTDDASYGVPHNYFIWPARYISARV